MLGKVFLNKEKTLVKSKFVTSSKSISYIVVLKRCLVRLQKGTFCKSIERLFKAKRACVVFELHENSLQTSVRKGTNKRKTPLHCS